MTVLQILGLFN